MCWRVCANQSDATRQLVSWRLSLLQAQCATAPLPRTTTITAATPASPALPPCALTTATVTAAIGTATIITAAAATTTTTTSAAEAPNTISGTSEITATSIFLS